MKNKIAFVIVTLLVALTMTIAGCISSTPAPSPSPKITPTSSASSTPTATPPVTPGASLQPSTTISQSPTATPTVPPTPTVPVTPSTGSLEVRVISISPARDVTTLNLLVSTLEILKPGAAESDASAWLPLKLEGGGNVDLLQIQGLENRLASGDLAPGSYSQVRMEISKVSVALKGGTPASAGFSSGKLKFLRPFEVLKGQNTLLLLDFNIAQSISVSPLGQIIYRPGILVSTPRSQGTIEIITPSLQNGVANIAYSDTLVVAAGRASYNWSLASGALPEGLKLDPSSGTVSGKPVNAGIFNFTVRVEDSSTPDKKSATRNFTLSVAAANTLQIATTFLPFGTRNQPYNFAMQSINALSPLNWGLVSGGLPSGLSIGPANGAVSGTPTALGDFSFMIRLGDGGARSVTQNMTMTISEDPNP